MTRNQYIREILIDNDNLNARQIMNLLIQKYPQIWNDKVAFYADAGKEKSESWVSNQLSTEISSTIRAWHREGKAILGKVNGITTFTVTDLYKKQLGGELQLDNDTTIIYEEDGEDEEETDCVNCNDRNGIVYFLYSDIFKDVSKIGKTIDLDKRIYDLSKDNRYGVFNLKVKGWIKVRNYGAVEKMFHNYFNKYRLYKDNFGINVDTELFKVNNFYDMWKTFIKVNYLDNPNMKDEIMECYF
jgi:hypothetical protein